MTFILINPLLTKSDKFLGLLEVTQCDPLATLGLLQIVWSRVLLEKPDGDLGPDGDSYLSDALRDSLTGLYGELGDSRCPVDPDSIVGLLVDAGFLLREEGGLVIPGWKEWSGKVTETRKKKAKAQARWRSNKKKKLNMDSKGASSNGRHLPKNSRDLHGKTSRHLQSASRHLHPECRHLQLETHENNRETMNLFTEPEKEGVSVINNINSNNYNNSFGSFTLRQVESGEADHLAPARILTSDSIKEAFAQVHRETWGSKVSPHSQELLKAIRALCVKEKRKPSEICRAVKGMAKDPWKKRREHNAWRYLVRDIDKWLSLADDESIIKNKEVDWGPWKEEGYETKEEWERSKQ